MVVLPYVCLYFVGTFVRCFYIYHSDSAVAVAWRVINSSYRERVSLYESASKISRMSYSHELHVRSRQDDNAGLLVSFF